MANTAKLLTAKEAAEYLRINVKKLYAWGRRKNGPPMYKLQRRRKSPWRVPKDKLDLWVKSKKE